MGEQTFQVGSVGQDILKFFFLSGGKNDSQKTIKFP